LANVPGLRPAPGAVHDLTAARIWGIVRELAASGLVVTGGTPGWQIVLIALGSALVAAALTLLMGQVARRRAALQLRRS
jgi:hypothetical protein